MYLSINLHKSIAPSGFHVGEGVMYRLSTVCQKVIFHIIFDVVLVSYAYAVHVSG